MRGLGLPTAKRIIEAPLGSIRIDCPAEGGTVVVIHLPDLAPLILD
jgi:K+-sensing histidine kinase KdpD